MKSWCADSSRDKDNGIWAQRWKNEKYQDKYPYLAITRLILKSSTLTMQMDFWFKWGGRWWTRSSSTLNTHQKNLIMEAFFSGGAVSEPELRAGELCVLDRW